MLFVQSLAAGIPSHGSQDVEYVLEHFCTFVLFECPQMQVSTFRLGIPFCHLISCPTVLALATSSYFGPPCCQRSLVKQILGQIESKRAREMEIPERATLGTAESLTPKSNPGTAMCTP